MFDELAMTRPYTELINNADRVRPLTVAVHFDLKVPALGRPTVPP